MAKKQTEEELRQAIETTREQAKEWAYQHLAGLQVVNVETGLPILISKSGLKHTLGLYRSNKEFELEVLNSIERLPQLLASAHYNKTETDVKNNGLTNVYHFRAEYTRSGTKYVVGIILKEQRKNDTVKVFYDHHIIHKK
jgi:Large polyvalent protein-associated domain 3